MTRITVLGASGFLGSALTAALSARPIRLRVVARRPTPVPADARADVEVCTADLTDPNPLADAVDGADVIINLLKHSGDWRLADRDPASESVNVAPMRALVANLRGRRSAGAAPLCLFAGTVSQVGVPPEGPLDGSEPDRPDSAYDRQKLAAERVLKAATDAGVLRGASLRLPTVYGQRSATSPPDVGVVASMVRRALAGEALTMWNDGTVRRELVYIDDAAAAFLAAVDRPGSVVGRHWLVGTGQAVPLGGVFRAVARAVAAFTGKPPVPVLSTAAPTHAVATDFRSQVIDPTPFCVAAGWSARVPLHEGIARTVAALAEQAATGAGATEGWS